jgi:tRNA G37 N-methylase Trm5
MAKVKDLLKNKLTKKELELVPSAFDVVGSILIFSDFPKELIKKEKIVANAFLEQLRNIKTVCKKTGKYSGVYRTPKLKILAGEKTKETIHKENSISLKLDVEKVYFSTRSGNERLRISKQVKEGEDVLVMFSGCAPFPCVIAKNSEPNSIVGVEINPTAHKYALENIKLNKINNIFLINKDVNKCLPNLYQHIIGLKSAIYKNELYSRTKYNPLIVELHTFTKDYDKNFKLLKNTIKKLVKQGKYIYLHQPMDDKGLYISNYNIIHPIYNKMISLVDEFNISLILHINENKENPNKQNLVRNIISFKKYYPNIFFEHGAVPYPNKLNQIKEVILKSGLKNLCIDTCHLLHNYKPSELPKIIKEIKKLCNVYVHLADYKNNSHASPLNKNSYIKLEHVLPLIDKGIVEIISENEKIGKQMIESWNYLNNFNKTFDRILMPLPRSAEEFLELALTKSKKGTIIHFYDFLNEKDFNLAKEKVAKACKKLGKKFKVLELVKCGHFGPGVYRVSLDFEVL